MVLRVTAVGVENFWYSTVICVSVSSLGGLPCVTLKAASVGYHYVSVFLIPKRPP